MVRTSKDIEQDICLMEDALEYAETHQMWKQAAKISENLRELDLELEEITGHESSERLVTVMEG